MEKKNFQKLGQLVPLQKYFTKPSLLQYNSGQRLSYFKGSCLTLGLVHITPEEFEKRSYLSQKWSFSKTLLKPEKFQNVDLCVRPSQ